MPRSNEHPPTDDSEAETDIITPMKPKAEAPNPARINGQRVKEEEEQTRATSPSPTNNERKRKASATASSGSRRAGSSPSDIDASSAKKARISLESDESSSDDGEASDINVGRSRSRRINSRRNGQGPRSERDSGSRTQSPNDVHTNDLARSLRSNSPHSTVHRRSASMHTSAVSMVTDREKRARKRVASHETATDQDSPAPPIPRQKADRSGRTPIAKACDDGDEDKVTALLVNVGSEIDQTDHAGNTPLQFACNGGFVNIVRMLLEAGARMDTCNVDGETPWKDAEDGLKTAQSNEDDEEEDNYTKILDLLRTAGYDPKQSKEFQKQYPKHRAHFISYKPAELLKYVKDRDVDSVEKVLEAGVRPGTEALVAACNAGDHDIFSKLVAKGMETDLNYCYPKKVKGGETPMAAALHKGAVETVEFLRDAPGYNALQMVQGTPYYKLAAQRDGTPWRKMRRLLRDDWVRAKREKGEEADVSEDDDPDDKRAVAAEEEAQSRKEAEERAARETAQADGGAEEETEAKVESSPAPKPAGTSSPPAETPRAGIEALEEAKEAKDSVKRQGAEQAYTVMTDDATSSGMQETSSGEGAPTGSGNKHTEKIEDDDTGEDAVMSEAPNSTEVARTGTPSESTDKDSKHVLAESNDKPSHDPEAEAPATTPDIDMKDDALAQDTMETAPTPADRDEAQVGEEEPTRQGVSELAQGEDKKEEEQGKEDEEEDEEEKEKVPEPAKEPTPPPPTPPPEPEPPLPRALETLLDQNNRPPQHRDLSRPWVKPLDDYSTVYVFRQGDIEPECEPGEVDSLYMMAWQASVLLGHATLSAIASVQVRDGPEESSDGATVSTKTMSVAHREKLWQHAALRSWLNRDADWEEAPRDILSSQGAAAGVICHVDDEDGEVTVHYARMSPDTRRRWLELPASHALWLRFDDFLRLGAASDVLSGLRITRDGSMRLDTRMPGKAIVSIPRTVFLAGQEVGGKS